MAEGALDRGMIGARISGVGHYAPEALLTNFDLERMLDTSDEWITTRTGMHRRHIAAPDEFTSDLAVKAARNALERSGYEAADIDCFIVATVTPDYTFPATGCIVASKLGVPGKAGFDIEIACSGFIYGLTIASSLVRSGVFKRVMIIGAETLSKIVNYEDRTTAILFGDAAGAAIIEQSDVDSFLACELGSDGTNPSILHVPSGGSKFPIDAEAIATKQNKIHMNGREVFKFAVYKMIESLDAALAKANMHADDVTFLIPHQANKRIIDAAATRLALPPERVIVNIGEYANTSAATIPVALSETVAKGILKNDDVIAFVGMGGGLSWGAVLWRWAA